MIELCLQGTRDAGQKIKRFGASPAGIFIFAALPGVTGIVVLLTFLSTFLGPPALLATLPFAAAFNSAASGYGLIDKGGSSYAQRPIALAGLAVLLSVTGCIAIVVFCPWEPLFAGPRYLTTGFAALAFTFFGAWLADKSNSHKKTS